MTAEQIKHIIATGKLRTYNITPSFTDVYWETPDQKGTSTCYVFKFLTLDEKLLSVAKQSSLYQYRRYQPKKYVPKMNALIERLEATLTV